MQDARALWESDARKSALLYAWWKKAVVEAQSGDSPGRNQNQCYQQVKAAEWAKVASHDRLRLLERLKGGEMLQKPSGGRKESAAAAADAGPSRPITDWFRPLPPAAAAALSDTHDVVVPEAVGGAASHADLLPIAPAGDSDWTIEHINTMLAEARDLAQAVEKNALDDLQAKRTVELALELPAGLQSMLFKAIGLPEGEHLQSLLSDRAATSRASGDLVKVIADAVTEVLADAKRSLAAPIGYPGLVQLTRKRKLTFDSVAAYNIGYAANVRDVLDNRSDISEEPVPTSPAVDCDDFAEPDEYGAHWVFRAKTAVSARGASTVESVKPTEVPDVRSADGTSTSDKSPPVPPHASALPFRHPPACAAASFADSPASPASLARPPFGAFPPTPPPVTASPPAPYYAQLCSMGLLQWIFAASTACRACCCRGHGTPRTPRTVAIYDATTAYYIASWRACVFASVHAVGHVTAYGCYFTF